MFLLTRLIDVKIRLRWNPSKQGKQPDNKYTNENSCYLKKHVKLTDVQRETEREASGPGNSHPPRARHQVQHDTHIPAKMVKNKMKKYPARRAPSTTLLFLSSSSSRVYALYRAPRCFRPILRQKRERKRERDGTPPSLINFSSRSFIRSISPSVFSFLFRKHFKLWIFNLLKKMFDFHPDYFQLKHH